MGPITQDIQGIQTHSVQVQKSSVGSEKPVKGSVPAGSVPTGSVPTIKTIKTILADNETGDLRWNRPDRPEPLDPNSSYRRIGCIPDGSCFFHAIAKGLSEVYQSSYRETSVTEEQLQKIEKSVDYAIRFPSELFDIPRTNNPLTVYKVRRPPQFKEDMSPVFQKLLSNFRKVYAQKFRKELAEIILKDNQMDKIIRNRLSGTIESETQAILEEAEKSLLGGKSLDPNFNASEEAVKRVKNRLVNDLLSMKAVSPDFILLLSDYLGVDIYLLRDEDLENPNPKNIPLYGGTSLHESVCGPSDMRPYSTECKSKSVRRAIVLISVKDIHYELVGRVDQARGESLELDLYPTLSQNEPLVRQLYLMLEKLRLKT